MPAGTVTRSLLVDLAVALAAAIAANLLDDLAGAAATRTSAADGKKSLRKDLLAAPVARRASDLPLPGSAPLPWHRSHGSSFGTCISTALPNAASSKVSVRS